MTIAWLLPLVLFGLASMAIPVVLHLVGKQRTQRRLFPTIRFIPLARVAALRRRVISEWPLLLVRMSTLAVATAALAGPVIVTEGRRTAWNQRVARATVSYAGVESEVLPVIDAERRGSFSHAQFSAASLPDAIREAVDWLQRQPPAARELVVIGDLREGLVTKSDFDRIPANVGIRFREVVEGESRRAALQRRAIADHGTGAASPLDLIMTVDAEQTRVRYEEAGHGEPLAVGVVAAPADQPHADAVLRAVLRDGVSLGGDPSRRLTIAFAGSPTSAVDELKAAPAGWMRDVLEQTADARGGERDGALVVRLPMIATDPRAATRVAEIVRRSFGEALDRHEPRRVSKGTQAEWSRPFGPSPSDAVIGEEGDRRWFWAVVLALIALEQLLRRRASVRIAEQEPEA